MINTDVLEDITLTFQLVFSGFDSTPCPEKKGATLFFAITMPDPNQSSKFFYHHTQQ